MNTILLRNDQLAGDLGIANPGVLEQHAALDHKVRAQEAIVRACLLRCSAKAAPISKLTMASPHITSVVSSKKPPKS